MALHKTKPTSPARRHQVRVVNPDLHKGGPWEPLLAKKSKSGGRNSAGRLSLIHISEPTRPRLISYAVFVALEIYYSVTLLMATANVANRNTSSRVTTTGL